MSRKLAGLAGIAFPVLTFVAFMIASPPGGSYKQSNVTDFLKTSHHAAIVVSIYLVILATLAFVALLAQLREAAGDGRTARVFWGIGIVSATALAAGFAAVVSVPAAQMVGGSDVASLDPKLAYFFSEVGDAMLFGAMGILLGVALIVLALARPSLPAPLRWFTLLCGAIGLASPAFFPFFALLIWSVVTGIWLLRSEPVPATVAATA